MGAQLSSIFPPKPTLTEENLADQSGKVFVITGSSAGLGKVLASFLYQHNAKVYLAARSQSKALQAIKDIQAEHPRSKGALVYLHLDLADLTTIKKSVQDFLAKETRLDVLWNNAGVMVPPQGSKTAQGYELQLGTNNLGHFLFTKLLQPILDTTAKSSPANSVRVVWVSSSAVAAAPKPAIDFTNMDYKREEGIWVKYGRSKAGNVLHAAEFARRTKGSGIISVSLNPGNLRTDLQRTMPGWQKTLFNMITYAPKYGAYTELYAGLHRDISEKNNGGFIAPFGRIAQVRIDLLEPALGRKYWDWSDEQVRPYL